MAGMTAAEFRAKRIRDAQSASGREREGRFHIPGECTHKQAMSDFGRGDMSGETDTWSPPDTGYRMDANERQFHKTNGTGRRGVHNGWSEYA